MAEPRNTGGGGLVMASPGVLQLVGAALIAPLAVLWMVGPLLPFDAAWTWWAGKAALTAATIAVSTMLTIAIGLAVADWLTDIESRKAWAAIGVGAADLSAMPAVQVPVRRGDFYAPAANNEAPWAILRAHRHAVCPSCPSTDGTIEPEMSLRRNALQPTVADEVDAVGEHEMPGTARELIVDAIGSRTLGRPARAKPEAEDATRARALTARADWRKRQRLLGVRMVTRLRRVANAQPWGAWSDFDRRSAPKGLPIRVLSNIIVLGQGKQRSTDGERPPEPSRDTFSAGSNAGRDPRARIRSFQPEISFEAERQLIALAEALGRQAAREDEAAERLAERSRSPPDVPAENSPGRDEKEDIG